LALLVKGIVTAAAGRVKGDGPKSTLGFSPDNLLGKRYKTQPERGSGQVKIKD
jgi:hypothetical protein